jgi:polysaccharide pyruvyl transferase WcaK-like protein
MVKITVIGWYGTETIGDRAILAGLISLFSEAYTDFEIKLGAIYPFFTERTLYEDMDFLCRCAHKERLNISIFDSRNKKELDDAIKNGDMLVMGGGPLMGMACMFMVEYAFAKAKKLHKKTMILGCGVGPMRKKIYEHSLVNIVQKSDITIFRDSTSRQEYNRMSHCMSNSEAAIDPAVFAALLFQENNEVPKEESGIAVTIREFPEAYKISKSIQTDTINKLVFNFVRNLTSYNETIHLIPMHYFSVGYDDRIFMNQIRSSIGNDLIIVQNNPLSLYETMHYFSSASMCVGMRFHSVVLQTILNGKNIILDYTDPATGKIGNFIRQINAEKDYEESYVALQTTGAVVAPDVRKKPFKWNKKIIELYRDRYVINMKNI